MSEKLIQYGVVKLAGVLRSSDPSDLAKVSEKISDWLGRKERTDIAGAALHKDLFNYGTDRSSIQTARLNNDQGDFWAMEYRHRCSHIPGRWWSTEVTLARPARRDDNMLGLRLNVLQTQKTPYKKEYSIPRLFRDLCNDPGLISDVWPIQPYASYLGGGDYHVLMELLEDPNRSLPVVVVSLPNYARNDFSTCMIDPDRLAHHSVGLAHVVVVDNDLSQHMLAKYNRRLATFDGAVRTYFQNFRPFEEDSGYHPFATRDQIVDAIEIERQINHLLYDRSTGRRDYDALIPSFAQLQGQALQERVKSRPSRAAFAPVVVKPPLEPTTLRPYLGTAAAAEKPILSDTPEVAVEPSAAKAEEVESANADIQVPETDMTVQDEAPSTPSPNPAPAQTIVPDFASEAAAEPVAAPVADAALLERVRKLEEQIAIYEAVIPDYEEQINTLKALAQNAEAQIADALAIAAEEESKRLPLEQEATALRGRNQDLELENASLKGTIADLSRQLGQVKSGNGHETRPKDNPFARIEMPDPVPAYKDMAHWIQTNLAGRIILPKRAVDSLSEAIYAERDLVLKAVLLLANEYRDMRHNAEPGSPLHKQFLESTQSLGLIDGESYSTKRGMSPGFASQYEVKVGRHKYALDRHLQKGTVKDDRRCLRVYYSSELGPDGEIIIGHLPSHLDNRMT